LIQRDISGEQTRKKKTYNSLFVIILLYGFQRSQLFLQLFPLQTTNPKIADGVNRPKEATNLR
jgi:hypothetical protein